MIYWINGAYGVGKSTVAEELAKRLGKAHIYDAEEMGNAVRDNYPEECKHSIIFEGYPLWREFNYLLIKDICNKFDGDIIVPMTLVLEDSYLEIIDRLIQDGLSVKYFILDADWQTIHDRILKRGEREGCWCMENITMCLDSQQKDTYARHIATTDKPVEKIVDEILSYK